MKKLVFHEELEKIAFDLLGLANNFYDENKLDKEMLKNMWMPLSDCAHALIRKSEILRISMLEKSEGNLLNTWNQQNSESK